MDQHSHEDGAACACTGTHKHAHASQEKPCACTHQHEHPHTEHEGCACGHSHDQEPSHEHGHENCSCSHNHADSCGCGHNHSDDDGCGCGHDHGVVPEKNKLIADAIRIVCALSLLIAAEFAGALGFSPTALNIINIVLCLAGYLLAGYEVLWTAFKNITKGRVFDENFLMAVATLGAIAVGDYAEAVAVMIFYGIGETLQGIAVAKSRANIASLMDIRPEFARVMRDGNAQQVPPEQVQVDEVIRVQPGERVPLDCTVLEGNAAVDASALTGESVPVAAAPGVHLVSGSVNLNGVLTCRVDSIFSQSTVQKILSLVSDASSKKARAEKFITRFSKIYTPCVMAAAALIAVVPPLLGFGAFSDWFYRGLIFLVVSCPCALVISVPVSFLGGIGGAAKNGVLVKGGDVIDLLTAPKAIVLDKTGTLTQGKFSVRSVIPAEGINETQLLSAAALCERDSKHPIALSVRSHCAEQDTGAEISAYEEKAGHGVLATTAQGVFAAGNAKLMAAVGATLPEAARALADTAGTVLYLAQDSRYLGAIVVADAIKPDTKQAIDTLRALGVERCFMLTGDNEAVAKQVAQEAGLDGYKAGLLPHEKVAAYEELTRDVQGVSMFAGDGINDAPLLARADLGVAMGGVGSDAAIEAADVVLMTDELTKIAQAIKVARQTRGIVQQNIVFALGVKLVVLVVAALGYTPMWLAIFADVGVALIAIANAARAVRLHG